MTQVAIYARYSSDNQREASVEGQFRLCREYAKRQGWQLVESCSDQAISGASLPRPGHPDAPRGRAVQAVQRHPGGVARSDHPRPGGHRRVYQRMSGAMAMPPISSPTTSPHQTDDQPSAGKRWRLAACLFLGCCHGERTRVAHVVPGGLDPAVAALEYGGSGTRRYMADEGISDAAHACESLPGPGSPGS
jgi:hypothetical protein